MQLGAWRTSLALIRRLVYVGRGPLLVVGFVGFVGLLLACVLIFPKHLVNRTLTPGGALTPSERVKAENDVRTTLLQGVGGLLLVAGAIATWRQLHVNREGQVTERFTRAIDQLGSEKLAVRLGGIYALERIAKDSSRDHSAVMEILTAFVRTSVPWKDSAENQHSPEGAADEKKHPAFATDIQAVLTVLGRRVLWRKERPLHLVHTDLRETDLAFAHLEGAHLAGAHLEGADLQGAHLERAGLWDAHLEGADLEGADLEGADLPGAHLAGANLKRAHLAGANLQLVDLRGTYLEGADLAGADLRGAHLPPRGSAA